MDEKWLFPYNDDDDDDNNGDYLRVIHSSSMSHACLEGKSDESLWRRRKFFGKEA
jgi:hypothetical protein